jgi:hypothetical protein
MSKRARTIFVVVLVAIGLTVALAYGGFDALTGTGVLGVGQVQPPGLDEPPDALVATGKHVTRYEWTCIQRDAVDPIVNHWWGTITQAVRAEAIVKWNRLEMVLNYTFVGWVDDGEPTVDTNQTYAGAPFPELHAPACYSDFYLVEPWFEHVTVEDVEFSY